MASGFGCCAHDDADSHGVPILRSIVEAGVRCLNEETDGSYRRLLRPHCDASAKGAWVQSASDGEDAELLLHIPFSCTVRLRALCVSGGAGEGGAGCPARVRLFINTPDLVFDDARDGSAPAQELVLTDANVSGATWLPLRAARFNNVSSLQLLFTGGVLGGSGGPSRLYFCGLQGEVTGARRDVVHAQYEVRAQLSDHKAAGVAGRGAAAGGGVG